MCVLGVPDHVAPATNDDLRDVGIRSWPSGFHQHVAEWLVGRGVDVPGTADVTQHRDANQRRGAHGWLANILAQMIGQSLLHLRSEHSFERQVCHTRQLEQLPSANRQRLRELDRTLPGKNVALNLDDDAIAVLKVTLLETLAKEPCLPYAMLALGGCGLGLELRPALELSSHVARGGRGLGTGTARKGDDGKKTYK